MKLEWKIRSPFITINLLFSYAKQNIDLLWPQNVMQQKIEYNTKDPLWIYKRIYTSTISESGPTRVVRYTLPLFYSRNNKKLRGMISDFRSNFFKISDFRLLSS